MVDVRDSIEEDSRDTSMMSCTSENITPLPRAGRGGGVVIFASIERHSSARGITCSCVGAETAVSTVTGATEVPVVFWTCCDDTTGTGDDGDADEVDVAETFSLLEMRRVPSEAGTVSVNDDDGDGTDADDGTNSTTTEELGGDCDVCEDTDTEAFDDAAEDDDGIRLGAAVGNFTAAADICSNLLYTPSPLLLLLLLLIVLLP